MEIKYVRDLANFVEDGDSLGVFGEPGAGKSSFVIRICDKLSERGYKIKYLSADHPSFEIDFMIARWKVNPENFEVYDYFEVARSLDGKVGIEDIMKLFSPQKEVIVVDSLTAFLLKRSKDYSVGLSKIKEVIDFLNNFIKVISNLGKNKVLIATIDLKLVDRKIISDLEKRFKVTLWIKDINGKREVSIKRNGKEVFHGIIGYQGEVLEHR